MLFYVLLVQELLEIGEERNSQSSKKQLKPCNDAKGASKGGIKHLALYGPPGTPEGRKKGGHISQVRRKEHPEQYPHGVYLYRQEEVLKYAEIVRFSSSHHIERLKQFKNRKGVRVV